MELIQTAVLDSYLALTPASKTLPRNFFCYFRGSSSSLGECAATRQMVKNDLVGRGDVKLIVYVYRKLDNSYFALLSGEFTA